MPSLPTISQAELDVLKTLWSSGQVSVRQCRAALPDSRWAYTTVQTLLQRLESKNYASSELRDRRRYYRATCTRSDLVQDRLGDLSRSLCDGASTPLILGLVAAQELTQTEIGEFRSLLDSLEADRQPAPEPQDANPKSKHNAR